MRVMVVLSSLPLGGAERSAIAVLRLFPDVGIEPLLVTINRHRDSELAEEVSRAGIRRIDLDGGRMIDPKGWMRLRRIVRNERVDVVHTHDQDALVYAAIACTGGPPVVMTRHLVDEETISWRDRLRDQFVRAAARHGAAERIAVSEVVRRSFALQARMPERRIRVLHNGVDTSVFHPHRDPADVRRRLGWDRTRPVLTMIGVLRPGKGHDVLLRAVPRIMRTIPDIRVKIIGSGPEEAQLRAAAAADRLPVEFLGERADVAQLMSASTLVALPSWQEALPTVLIEAGACGTAVIATRVGGVEEIVTDGVTGMLVPVGDDRALADRVVELIEDEPRRREMGARAAERMSTAFSLRAHAQELRVIYDDVLRDGVSTTDRTSPTTQDRHMRAGRGAAEDGM